MKKLIIISALCMLNWQMAFSQETTTKTNYPNNIKFSVTSFFDNTFQVGYERRLCPNSGLLISAGMTYKKNNSTSIQGFKTDVQYKNFVYNKERENSGMRIYFAPYLQYRYTERTDNYFYDFPPYGYPSTYYFNSFSGGVLFGLGFTVAKKISIDAYVGGGIKRSFGAHLKDNLTSYSSNIWDPGYNGITPKGGIDVGFKF